MNMASEVRLGTKSKRKLFSVGIPQIDLRINDDKLSRTSENLSAGSACVSPTKEQLLNENERLKKELGRLKMKQKTVKSHLVCYSKIGQVYERRLYYVVCWSIWSYTAPGKVS